MKIERRYVPTSTLEEFAERHDLTMVVCERGIHATSAGTPRYFAYFSHAEVLDKGFLVGVCGGDDDTEQAAISDYARRISEKTLVIDPFDKHKRRELAVPRLCGDAPESQASE